MTPKPTSTPGGMKLIPNVLPMFNPRPPALKKGK